MRIKIRFIKQDNKYHLQRKMWWGWKGIRYRQPTMGGDLLILYQNDSKKDLLKDVIENVYKTTKKHLRITEYPTIYKY